MVKTETGEELLRDIVTVEDLISHLEVCDGKAKILFSVDDSDPVPLKEFCVAGNPTKVVISFFSDTE